MLTKQTKFWQEWNSLWKAMFYQMFVHKTFILFQKNSYLQSSQIRFIQIPIENETSYNNCASWQNSVLRNEECY